MTRRASRTLLDFAIAASIAVLPILLAVLVVVAWLRPLDATSRASREGDRHISVRQVAALKTFEFAIVRRDGIREAVVTAQAILDGIPACRSEWDGRGRGVMAAVRRRMMGADDAGPTPADRIARELAQLDDALQRFSTGANRRVTDAVGFESRRWFEAVAVALRTPTESPEYPGHRFVVQCSDIAVALAALTRGNARMLEALAWRGSEVRQVVARWRPEQFVEVSPRQIARANPWSGVPGCVYMGRTPDNATFSPAFFVTETRGIAEKVCAQPAITGLFDPPVSGAPEAIRGEATPDLPANDTRWGVPPSLHALLRSLDTLRRPTGTLYRLYADSTRQQSQVTTVERLLTSSGASNTPMDVGFTVDITIDPSVQALAQKTAACYTGRQDVCQAMGIRRKEDEGKAVGNRLLEHAMVRMAAVAVIDVESGRIEALAGALSPCTRQEYDGPGRSKACDRRLPYPIRYRPDALLNPAVFHDAMPASVIKPIMAASFLSDPEVGARWLASERAELQRTAWPTRDSLRGQLMRSDSARFLDRMFCADKGFANCARPWNVQTAAAAFGWNAGCANSREDCGKRDLLFGRSADAIDDGNASLASVVPFGRLLVEPAAVEVASSFRLRPKSTLDTGKVRACAAGPDGRRGSSDDWEKCRGRVVVDVVADGWGQGNARSSALGVAGMMAALATAANGEPLHPPHLVHAIRGADGADAAAVPLLHIEPPAAQPPGISRDAAELILNALSYSHRGGTARAACEQIFDARTCRDIDWIAGKTGTPTFPNDDVSLDQLAQLCAQAAPRTRSMIASCGALRPYKWYVAAYRTDPSSARWTKVIGVLTERNWIADTGRIHGAGDHGPNPAAEIALQIAARHSGRFGDHK